MKPIKLKFKGLQSYRKPQEIDFQQLGQRGIFGIFGPTGGGKSTILDAITLALYGNVQRAPNGIRGIMNHLEDELWVSFEFLLGNFHYLVERSYKRTKKEESILNKAARLVLINGEEKKILADKATEVTSKIQELLGMEFTDFTRAVIIPQNKFDEFLKLTDKERTEMLEKIFSLEEYGEKLTEKVKRLEKQLEAEYNSNNNIMLELGDVSQQAISKVKIELEEKKKLADEKNRQLIDMQEKLQKMEQAAIIYQEMIDLKKEKEKLQEELGEIEKNKIKLHLAKKAEGIKVPLSQIYNLDNKIKEEEKKLQQQKILENQADIKLQQAQLQLEKVKENQKQLDYLREEKLSKIPLAVNYEEQINELQEEIRKLEDIIYKSYRDKERLEEEINKRNFFLVKTQKDIEVLKENNIRINNLFYCRQEVDDAILLLKVLEGEEKQEKAAFEELENKRENLNKEEKTIRNLLAKYLKAPLEEIEKKQIEDLLKDAQEVLNEAINRQEELQHSLDKIKDKNMAKVLSYKLEDGKPCLVCGSTHHPKPAYLEVFLKKDEVYLAKEELNRAKERLELLRKWQQELSLHYNNYQNIKREIKTNYEIFYANKLKELNQTKEKFNEIFKVLQKKIMEILPNFIVDDKDKIKKLKEELKKADEDYRQLKSQIEEKERLFKELNKDITDLKENYKILCNSIKNYEENLQKNKNKLKELIENKKKLIGDTTALIFEEEIKHQIIELEREIVKGQELWQEAFSKKQEIDENLTVLKSGIEKMKEHRNNMEEELKENLIKSGFNTIEEVEDVFIDKEEYEKIEDEILKFESHFNHITKSLEVMEKKAASFSFDKIEFQVIKENYQSLSIEYNEIIKEEGALQNSLNALLSKQKRWQELEAKNKEVLKRKEEVSTLFNLLKGKKFVKFLAEEHMRDMAVEASIRLGELTGQRYSLELDDKGNFMMRDDYNNGSCRLVSSLSGGEIFLTSLSLALALSSKIQLKGRPLGFFFIDEGFGTLDNEKLELVMSTLEKLQQDQRMVGIISHVEELKNRMPRYIEVTPAKGNGEGSKLEIKYN